MGIFNNKIKLYLVTNDTSVSKDKLIIYSVAGNKKDAKEYLEALIKIKCTKKFQEWCETNKVDFKDKEIWELYRSKELALISFPYQIRSVVYDADKISMMLRMFDGCIPLGCSFEKEIEYQYFTEKLKKITKKND